MNPVEKFREQAADCREMARVTRDKGSKLTWVKLAERWERCAELARISHIFNCCDNQRGGISSGGMVLRGATGAIEVQIVLSRWASWLCRALFATAARRQAGEARALAAAESRIAA